MGNKLIKGQNDFLTIAPDSAKDWDYAKNSIKPDEVCGKSNKKFWFICKNGHSYLQTLNQKTFKNAQCPICSGQQLLKGYNDLKTRYPKIAEEWDYSKNEKNPEDYTYGSGYKAWWKCNKCGLSYQSYINVHIRGHKCPYCAGNKIFPGYNDLKTLFPELAKEYSEDNKKPSNEISPYSHHKVKWNCPICGKEYFSSPNHRKRGNGCPHCTSSSGEQEIVKILDEYKIEYKRQKWFPDLRDIKPLKFDFAILKDGKILGFIEYNGKQHYTPIKHFGEEEEYIKRCEHDRMKIEYCMNHDYPILHIPYASIPEYSPKNLVINFLTNLNLISGKSDCAPIEE